LSVPFGIYNEDTIRAAKFLGYKVFCGYYSYRLSRRLFYIVGHFLRKNLIFGRRISNHLTRHPGSEMLQIDTGIDFIKTYFGDGCEMFSCGEIMKAFARLEESVPVVVLVLHHNYFREDGRLSLIGDVLDRFQERDDLQFVTYESVYSQYTRSLHNHNFLLNPAVEESTVIKRASEQNLLTSK
jgi:hypothetical protein